MSLVVFHTYVKNGARSGKFKLAKISLEMKPREKQRYQSVRKLRANFQ